MQRPPGKELAALSLTRRLSSHLARTAKAENRADMDIQRRITIYKAGATKRGSGTTAYAWFVWDRSHEEAQQLHWIEPGYKARFAQ